ncbi:hypothetical protein [Schlesneria paludicola]|uniref:hypothetical protein n=1 Tax=Schlesneria paludicola TaxID=360056 RepID=UPI00029B46A1|nr:hypothetical protein [Schlesneria paludicola]
MQRQTISLIFGCALLLTMAGCGGGGVKIYTASGELSLDGEPFGPTSIRLIPLKEGNRSAVGTVDKSGKITFTTLKTGDGLPAGQYRVAVGIDPGEPPRLYPKIYGDFGSSPLQANVDAVNDNQLKLQMTKSAGPLIKDPKATPAQAKFDVNAAFETEAFKAGAK